MADCGGETLQVGRGKTQEEAGDQEEVSRAEVLRKEAGPAVIRADGVKMVGRIVLGDVYFWDMIWEMRCDLLD